MNKKTGIIIGGVAGGILVIAGVIAAFFLLKGKQTDSYRVIKVILTTWKHMSEWLFRAAMRFM